MGTYRRPAALGIGLISLALTLLTAAIPAQAIDPPPLGQPTDHFAGRHPIGEQGIVTLGDTASNSPLKLRRIALQQHTPAGDPAPPDETTNPPQMTGSTDKFSTTVTDGPTGFIQADLDTIVGSDGALRGALEPGLLVAGQGIASSNGCPGAGFCLTWLRPSYDSDHRFSDFASGGRIAVPFGVDVPTAGTDVALATGTFRAGEGPSIVAAWVHTPAAGAKQIHFAHFVAQRNASGRVTGLQLDGAVQDLGDAYTDPSLGATSPAIAIGDFAGTGKDQAAVVWGAPRAVATTPRLTATLLDGSAAGPGLGTSVPAQTFDAQDDAQVVPGEDDGQVGPGAVAQHDVRDGLDPIDRLIVGPGVSGARYLYRLDVGATFTVQKLDGPTVANPAPSQPATYMTSNSELDSLGDLDGDGLDEILATPYARFNPNSTDPRGYLAAGCSLSSSAICGRIEILDFDSDFPELGDGFTVDSTASWENRIETAVVDTRPTKDQRIAPPPGAVDLASLPQVAVNGYVDTDGPFGGNSVSPFFALESINASEGLVAGGGDLDIFNQLTPNSARRPPRLAGLALDGEVELGDPVQDGYRSLEPSVVLNAPPTHFDILDGEAFDPNVCYAGNQYEGNCAFESEYERSSSASTDVSTESSEDWAVSSTVTADADFGVAQLSAEVRAGYGENFTKVDGSSETETVTVNVKARNTDKIYAMRRAYDTLEYPLYQPGSSEPEYLLSTTPHTLARRWIDSSSPEALELGVNHQPGNILSYPEDLSEAENPFISPTKGTDDLTKTTFGQDEFELSDSSDYSYSLTKSKVDSDSASTSKTWNVGATVSGGGGIGFVNVSAEVSGDYSQSNLSNISTTIGDDTLLASTMGGIDESFGETAYTVKPFAYWTDSAALVLDYAVEPSVAPPGSPKTWWQLEYGARPDLTLNLPRLLDFEEQAGITSDAARFISPGVRVLEGPCSHPAPLNPEYPEAGKPLCLVAQVENYSLKDGSTPTSVEFYDADPDLGGELIGQDNVAAVGARDHAVAFADWTPGVQYAGTTPRIFAEVDAGDAVREIHEENNKGFRSYEAVASSTPALHPPEDVLAELGADESSLDVEWNVPAALSAHQWLVRAYPDDGGAPVAKTVPGGDTSTSIPIPNPGTYRVVVFAVQGNGSSAASHPAEPVDVGIASSGGTSVRFLKAPDEGGFTGSSVEIAFEATPDDAETECIVDGESRPCRSPLRLGGLEPGSHTIQVQATSNGATAGTPMIAWTVDDSAPTAALMPLDKLTRHDSVALDYRGADLGGSQLDRYEVRVRRSHPRGEFTTDPVTLDRSAQPVRQGSVAVGPGETACVSVRAIDGAGNNSGWTDERCTTREIGESVLHKDGKWRLVHRKSLSDGHALQTSRSGPSLSFALDGTDEVRVFAGRCRNCGRLEVQINGHRRKVIDLGQTKKKASSILAFDAGWNKRGSGNLRLVARGGGEVRVDGIAIWRAND